MFIKTREVKFMDNDLITKFDFSRSKEKATKKSYSNASGEYCIYLFLNEDNLFSMSMKIDDERAECAKLNGLNTIIKTDYFESIKGCYITISCKEALYNDKFFILVNDIIKTKQKSSKLSNMDVINEVFLNWKNFFQAPRRKLLSDECIIGLLGELIFLEKLYQLKFNDPLSKWVANDKEDKTIDFKNNEFLIEVKSSKNSIHKHIINGIDQLCYSSNYKKFMLSLNFIESNDEISLSLPGIIQKICAHINKPIERNKFEEMLYDLGYDKANDFEYEKHAFSLVDSCFFSIDKNLPKLTKYELKNNSLDKRITNLSYKLDLEGFASIPFDGSNLEEVFM